MSYVHQSSKEERWEDNIPMFSPISPILFLKKQPEKHKSILWPSDCISDFYLRHENICPQKDLHKEPKQTEATQKIHQQKDEWTDRGRHVIEYYLIMKKELYIQNTELVTEVKCKWVHTPWLHPHAKPIHDAVIGTMVA